MQRRAAESTVALQLRPTGRRGFSNAALVALLGLLALISALALIQSGQLDFTGLFPKPIPAAARAKRTTKGKPQKLLPRAPVPAPVSSAIPAKQVLSAPARSPRRELYEALPRMDADAAARMLAEMDVGDAVLLLQQLKERDMARILEAASPLDSARWVKEMLETLPPLEIFEPTEGQVASASGEQEAVLPTPDEEASEVSTATTVESVEESETGSDDENQPESDSDTDANEAPADGSAPSGATSSQLPPGTNTA